MTRHTYVYIYIDNNTDIPLPDKVLLSDLEISCRDSSARQVLQWIWQKQKNTNFHEHPLPDNDLSVQVSGLEFDQLAELAALADYHARHTGNNNKYRLKGTVCQVY